MIREWREGEEELLRTFLYEAIFVPEGEEPPARDIVDKPELRVYYEDFGSGAADCALVAEEEGKPVGLAWARIMDDYGHLDEETPSLAIALLREYRGQGIGTRLMKELLARLKERGTKRVSLSVQKANAALHLYERLGFEVAADKDDEYIMVLPL